MVRIEYSDGRSARLCADEDAASAILEAEYPAAVYTSAWEPGSQDGTERLLVWPDAAVAGEPAHGDNSFQAVAEIIREEVRP